MGVFVISKRDNGQFKFSFDTRRKKTIFTSISCKRKSDCEMMIEGMRENIGKLTYTRNRRGSGKLFFRISTGGFVLATSRNFNTEFSMQKAMDDVLKYVPKGEIIDFTENDFVFPPLEDEEQDAAQEISEFVFTDV
ncbi:MAG: DUF1508 domain-containing protein [Bacteroidia bacterium]